MWVKRRHKIFHFFFRWLVNLVFRIKLNFRSKKVKLKKGPHLILFNHPTNYDPIFVGSTFNRPTYFIANEDLFNIPYASKILNYLVAPIPKKKSVRDTSAIKTAIKVVREGGNIGVSPEGNRTYSGRINNIDIAIVKFARLLKVPIVLYTISGGFGVNPRFSTKVRKGRIDGKVEKILKVEEINKMSDYELLDVITKTLDVDDTKLNLKFKGKNLAEDLESVFYICSVCKKFHTISSKGNEFKCNNCNLTVKYNESLTFETNNSNFKFKTVNDYYVWQNNYIQNSNFEEITFKDENIEFINANIKKKEHLYNGNIKLTNEKVIVYNEENEHKFYIKDIVSLAVVYHNTLIINLSDRKYHIKGNDKFNALKYLHLFTLNKDKLNNVETKYLGI